MSRDVRIGVFPWLAIPGKSDCLKDRVSVGANVSVRVPSHEMLLVWLASRGCPDRSLGFAARLSLANRWECAVVSTGRFCMPGLGDCPFRELPEEVLGGELYLCPSGESSAFSHITSEIVLAARCASCPAGGRVTR